MLPQTWCGTARLQDLDCAVLLKLQRGRSRETRDPGVGSSACSPELPCLPDISWLTKERFTRLRFEVSYLTPFLHWFPVLGTAFQSAVKNCTVCHCVCLEGFEWELWIAVCNSLAYSDAKPQTSPWSSASSQSSISEGAHTLSEPSQGRDRKESLESLFQWIPKNVLIQMLLFPVSNKTSTLRPRDSWKGCRDQIH